MQTDLIERRNKEYRSIRYNRYIYTKQQSQNKLKQQLLQKEYNTIDELVACTI